MADVELGKLLRKGSFSHKGQWEARFDRLATGSRSSEMALLPGLWRLIY